MIEVPTEFVIKDEQIENDKTIDSRKENQKKRRKDSRKHQSKIPHMCEMCGKTYLRKDSLMRHFQMLHSTAADRTFGCDDCGKWFVSKPLLFDHIKKAHINNKTLHLCAICSKKFTSKKACQYHMETAHGENHQKLQCSICGVWSLNWVNLRRHMKRHNETVRKCPTCGKEAKNAVALRDHIRYVHTGRTKKCTLCDKAFSRNSELKVRRLAGVQINRQRMLYFPGSRRLDAQWKEIVSLWLLLFRI